MSDYSGYNNTNQCEECGGELIEGGASYLCSVCGLEHGSLYSTTRSTEGIELSAKEIRAETKLGTNHSLSRKNNLIEPKGNFQEEQLEKKMQRTIKKVPIQKKLIQDREQKVTEIMKDVFILLDVPPKFRDRAIYLYNTYGRCFIGKGQNRARLSAVAMYVTSFEFKDEFSVTIKEITSAYGTLNHNVSGKSILRLVRMYGLKDKSLGIKKSEDYISRICSLIYRTPDISDRILKTYLLDKYEYIRMLQSYSLEILKQIPYSKRGSKKPFPFAVGTVFVCDTFISRILDRPQILTKKIIAECTKVSEVTIRNNSEIIQSCDLNVVSIELSKEIEINLKP